MLFVLVVFWIFSSFHSYKQIFRRRSLIATKSTCTSSDTWERLDKLNKLIGTDAVTSELLNERAILHLSCGLSAAAYIDCKDASTLGNTTTQNIESTINAEIQLNDPYQALEHWIHNYVDENNDLNDLLEKIIHYDDGHINIISDTNTILNAKQQYELNHPIQSSYDQLFLDGLDGIIKQNDKADQPILSSKFRTQYRSQRLYGQRSIENIQSTFHQQLQYNHLEVIQTVDHGMSLFSKQAFHIGDVIFTDYPIVSSCDNLKYDRCSHCHKHLQHSTTITKENTNIHNHQVYTCTCGEVFCNKACYDTAMRSYHRVLCSVDYHHLEVQLRDNGMTLTDNFISMIMKLIAMSTVQNIESTNHNKNTESLHKSDFTMYDSDQTFINHDNVQPGVTSKNNNSDNTNNNSDSTTLTSSSGNYQHSPLDMPLIQILSRFDDRMTAPLTSEDEVTDVIACEHLLYMDAIFRTYLGSLYTNNYHIRIQELAELMSVLLWNAIGTENDIHSLILPVAFMNHDCDPNVAIYSNSYVTGNKVYAIALKEIQSTDELTICYIDIENMTKEDRQRQLLSQYNFICTCNTCKSDM